MSSIHHIAIRFAYDARHFPLGYARQPEGGTVEDALIQSLRREGYVAGSWRTGSRTDKGVSAVENVAACAIERPHLDGLIPALQSKMADGVWVTGVARVPAEWNPRHGAMRTYTYMAPKEDEELDAMARAAQCFEGVHDMSAFAKVEPHRDPQRDVRVCRVSDEGDAWRFTVASPGFLWNQVRRMVDIILRVGAGKSTVAAIQQALADGQPPDGAQLARPEGLLLESVRYEPAPDWVAEAGPIPRRGWLPAWQASTVQARLMGKLNALS